MENMTLFLVGGGIVLLLLLLTFITINQGYVAIITVFGKYSRIIGPGLHMRIPLIEVIYRKISIQNRSVELWASPGILTKIAVVEPPYCAP